MDGSACFAGLALAGGILAVLLWVGWYGDRKETRNMRQPNLRKAVARMMSVRLTIRRISCKNTNDQSLGLPLKYSIVFSKTSLSLAVVLIYAVVQHLVCHRVFLCHS